MSTSTDSSIQADKPARIDYFRIYKTSSDEIQPADINVFGNTRQQASLTVEFTALGENGNVVTVAETDIWKWLVLVDYGTHEKIPFSDSFANHPAWLASSKSQGYDWNDSIFARAGTASQETDPAPGAESTREEVTPFAQRVTFHVSTSSTDFKRIAVAFLKPDAVQEPGKDLIVIARTDNASINDPDGRGDGKGGFNSSVRVVGRSMASVSILYGDEYGNATLTPRNVGNQNNFFWATEHRVGVFYDMRPVAVRSASKSAFQPGATPDSFSIYQLAASPFDKEKWSLSYFAQPGSSTPQQIPTPPLRYVAINFRDAENMPEENTDVGELRTNYDPGQMYKDCVGTIESSSSTYVVIGLLTGNLAGTFLDANQRVLDAQNSSPFYMLDAYGNDHRVTLAFDGNVKAIRVS